MDLINPFTLTFSDPHLEHSFVAATAEAVAKTDAGGYIMGLVLTDLSRKGATGSDNILWILRGVLLLGSISFCFKKPAVYMRWRSAIQTLVACSTVTCTNGPQVLRAAPEPAAALFAAALVKSPAAYLLGQLVLCPLRFRHQLLVHLAMLVATVDWSRRFCALCDASDHDYSPMLSVAGEVNKDVVTILSLAGTGALAPRLACFSVVMFGKVCLGFLVPLFCLYNQEMEARVKHLIGSIPQEDEKHRIIDFKRACKGWSLWILTIGIILAWVMS